MPKKYQFDYDLIVIGSGAGGSGAATLSAKDGKRVAIIESETFGGDSPNYGDVPTKALMHAAVLYDEAKHGARFGLRSTTLGYNYPSLRTWKDLAVSRTGANGNKKYYEDQGVRTYKGLAHFISPNEISLNRRHLSAENFLIATGSSWHIPNIPGLESVGYLTPRTILESIKPPKSLLIIGGGSSGVEIAQMMAIFGTKVYVVEQAGRLLPHMDEEAGLLLARLMSEQKGIECMTHSRVLSVEKDGLNKRITVSRGGETHTIRVEEVLVSAGRDPRVDMGLENAGVKYTAKGLEVNQHLQTNVRHIYGAGDVIGHKGNTHTAIMESHIVAHNIAHRNKISPDYNVVPRVVFTQPNIATVGLSEDDCDKRDLKINKAVAPLSIIARSNTADFYDGFVKLITDKKGVLLGATIVSPGAGEMIHEITLALKHGMTASDLASIPHAFLSWSEAIRVASGKLS
jgi:mercuric reductase